ncbi:MAG: CHAD domain-containing protein [Solirubrobacterales bacterium]|nr:CHAD domain-containing protein [Solirubrobacterales bacterium]
MTSGPDDDGMAPREDLPPDQESGAGGIGSAPVQPPGIGAVTVEGSFRLAAARVLDQRASVLVTAAKGVLDVSASEPAAEYWLATGRMRSALRLFSPCLPALEARSCRKEVSRIGKAVRARRDTDAAVELCEGVIREMTPGSAAGLERALEILRRRQSELNRELARQIHGRRLQALRVRIEDLADQASRPVAGEHGDFPPLMEELPDPVLKLLLRRLERLRGLAPTALQPENQRDQHRMRVAAERLRYLLELTAPAIGSQAQTARRAARALQETIGEIRDSDLVPPALGPAVDSLVSEDVEAMLERGRGSRDLDPVLVLAAPNRAAYQGCELALVYALARRRLLFDRFRRLWLEQSRQGVWVGLETGIRRKIRQ